MEIKRDDYLDEIKAVMHNGLVKVITGQILCRGHGVAKREAQFPSGGAYTPHGECHILRTLQTWIRC